MGFDLENDRKMMLSPMRKRFLNVFAVTARMVKKG